MNAMDLWGPVIFLLACTALAIAVGVHIALAIPAGFLVTFLWAANALGGTKNGASFLMVVAFFSAPIAIGTAIAGALGMGLRSLLGKKSALESASDELVRASVATTFDQAVEIAGEQHRRGSRILVRCPKCDAKLSAKRVLSASRPSPDIEVSCRCGGCTRVLPFERGDA